MRYAYLIPVFFLLALQSAFAQITNMTTEGNLAVSNEFGCIALSEAKPSYTPPDFTRAVSICAREAAYGRGAELFGAAIMYGMQDGDRVSDRTAPQGLIVLINEMMAQLSDGERSQLKQAFDTLLDETTPAHAAFCEGMNKLGKPDYFPRYMVQHGMQAFLGNGEEPLIPGFPADENWADIRLKNGC